MCQHTKCWSKCNYLSRILQSWTLGGCRSMKGAVGSLKPLQVTFITVPSWLCRDKGTTQKACSSALVWSQHPAEKSFLLPAHYENCFLASLWHCSNKHTVSFRENAFTAMLVLCQNYSISSVLKKTGLSWNIIILINFTCYLWQPWLAQIIWPWQHCYLREHTAINSSYYCINSRGVYIVYFTPTSQQVAVLPWLYFPFLVVLHASL